MSLETEIEQYNSALEDIKKAMDAFSRSENSITAFFGSVVEELNRIQETVFEAQDWAKRRYIDRDHNIYLILRAGQLGGREMVENPRIELCSIFPHTPVSTYYSGDTNTIANNIARDLELAKKVIEDERTRSEQLHAYRRALKPKPDN